MKRVMLPAVLFAAFTVTLFGGLSVAFGFEKQDGKNTGMLEGTPATSNSACSDSFVKSLNKGNTVIWVNDPRYPNQHVPCCIKGMVCQRYPDYQQYVIAMPVLQSEYDCAKIAQDCGYTPICQVVVGEALDPTTICTGCVPYRFTFWATVYKNNNAPAPPPPPPPPPPHPPSDPCRGKICPPKTWCVNGRCVQVR